MVSSLVSLTWSRRDGTPNFGIGRTSTSSAGSTGSTYVASTTTAISSERYSHWVSLAPDAGTQVAVRVGMLSQHPRPRYWSNESQGFPSVRARCHDQVARFLQDPTPSPANSYAISLRHNPNRLGLSLEQSKRQMIKARAVRTGPSGRPAPEPGSSYCAYHRRDTTWWRCWTPALGFFRAPVPSETSSSLQRHGRCPPGHHQLARGVLAAL